MNKQHKALGRGLTALIPETMEEEGLVRVAVERIRLNPHQPRRGLDQKGLESLAHSIREKGLLQPLVVTRQEDGFQLISGERRLKAAVMAGLQEVPVIIRKAEGADHLELALVENLQREDLNPIEEALAYQRLLIEYGYSQEELSTKLGRDRSTIANRVRLLKLDAAIQEALAKGIITEGHARALLVLEDPASQQALKEEIVVRGLSVREAERRAKELAKPRSRGKEKKESPPYLSFLEGELREIFGTKVKVYGTQAKGKIVLEYYSQDDFDRILEIVTRRKPS